MRMSWRARFFLQRVLNVVRPKPRYIPLSVNDVMHSAEARSLVDRFNDFYYGSGIAGTLQWRGIPILKNPCDLWVITELLQELRPTAVIETGTHHGGSATYLADIASTLGIDCEVVTIDINPKWSYDPASKRIRSLIGRSTDAAIHAKVRAFVAERRARCEGHVLALLDSDHSAANVLDELRLYSEMITPGSFIIVEDTIVNGHPSYPSHGPGPWEAVTEFLAENDAFLADRERERHLMTSNPGGWLRRR